MKIAVFADIHSNYFMFKKGLDDSKKRGIDKYIFLGDYLTDGFDGNKVIEEIKKLDSYSINGNREVSLLEYDKNRNIDWNRVSMRSMKYGYNCLNKETLDFIKSLDISKIIKLENKTISMSHGSPYSVRGDVGKDSFELFDKLISDFNCDIYLFGHEHKSYCTIYKSKYFINPGTTGLPTEGEGFSYAIINIENDMINCEIIPIEYDYIELEKYYKESDYYNNATYWCEIVLNSMKTYFNHINHFLDFVKEKARLENIDITKNMPDDLFVESFMEYSTKNFK